MITVLYANDWNVGDHLSARGIEECLGVTVSKVTFERNPRLAEVLNQLSDQDLVIVGGGGLLKNSFDPFWQTFLDHQQRRGFAYAVWGVGQCDVVGGSSDGDRAVHSRVFQGALAATVRDAESASEIDADVAVLACPAHVAASLIGGVHSVADDTLLVVEHDGLLQALADHIGRPDLRALLDGVLRDHSVAHGLRLVAHDNYVRRSPVDRALSGRLASLIVPGQARLIRELRTRSVDEAVRKLFGPARAVVTSRLHGAIQGFSLGKPVVGVSGDRKIDRYFSSVGLAAWVASSPDDVATLVNRVAEQPSIEPTIGQICADNRDFGQRILAAWSRMAASTHEATRRGTDA